MLMRRCFSESSWLVLSEATFPRVGEALQLRQMPLSLECWNVPRHAGLHREKPKTHAPLDLPRVLIKVEFHQWNGRERFFNRTVMDEASPMKSVPVSR